MWLNAENSKYVLMLFIENFLNLVEKISYERIVLTYSIMILITPIFKTFALKFLALRYVKYKLRNSRSGYFAISILR